MAFSLLMIGGLNSIACQRMRLEAFVPNELTVFRSDLRLWFFGAIFRAAGLSLFGSGCVESASDDVISHAGKVFDSTAANHDHGVLLQIMPDSGNVSSDFRFVGQSHSCDFSERRVWFLGRGGFDEKADSTHLGISL